MPIKKSQSLPSFLPPRFLAQQKQPAALRWIFAVALLLFHATAHSFTASAPASDTLPPLAAPIKLPRALQGIENNMVRVDSGSFLMGCDANRDGNCLDTELPAHQVEVGTFYLCRFEVRQIDWLVVMKTDPSFFQGCDQCPVENMRWDDVALFIEQLNQLTGRKYRLPTEAEWEFAARGGTLSKATRYAGSNNLDEAGWYFSKEEQNRPHPVGQKLPNELGLYDMSGNVWEWCSDAFSFYKIDTDTAALDPADTFRPIRGGSWNSLEADCRIAMRNKKLPSYRYNAIGFRLAHDWEPPADEVPPKTEGKMPNEGKSGLNAAPKEGEEKGNHKTPGEEN